MKRLQELAVTGLEGGVNYWSYCNLPKSDGRPYWERLSEVELVETETGKSVYLTDGVLGQGLLTMRDKFPGHYADYEKDNADVVTGDVFLQCCLFGEIKYS